MIYFSLLDRRQSKSSGQTVCAKNRETYNDDDNDDSEAGSCRDDTETQLGDSII